MCTKAPIDARAAPASIDHGSSPSSGDSEGSSDAGVLLLSALGQRRHALGHHRVHQLGDRRRHVTPGTRALFGGRRIPGRPLRLNVPPVGLEPTL